jgi:hypothetical protein
VASQALAGWLAARSLVVAVGHPEFEHGSLLLMKKLGEGLSPWFNIFLNLKWRARKIERNMMTLLESIFLTK